VKSIYVVRQRSYETANDANYGFKVVVLCNARIHPLGPSFKQDSSSCKPRNCVWGRKKTSCQATVKAPTLTVSLSSALLLLLVFFSWSLLLLLSRLLLWHCSSAGLYFISSSFLCIH